MSDTPDESEPIIPLSTDIMDREERKAEKARAKKEKLAQKKLLEDDKVEDVLAESSLERARKAKRKNMMRLGYALIGLLVGIWLFNFLFSPYQGDMRFGICKTFLELNVRFPQKLEYNTVEEFPDKGFVRIWYTQMDAFGANRMQSIQCHYVSNTDPQVAGGYAEILDKIVIDRRLIQKERVDEFNRILLTVVNAPIDLTVPYNLPASLRDLHFETDKFRFQLNVKGVF